MIAPAKKLQWASLFCRGMWLLSGVAYLFGNPPGGPVTALWMGIAYLGIAALFEIALAIRSGK